MDNVKKFKEIANSLGELYEQKNKCYNNSFGDTYKKLGIISAVTRISDKYNRLCNLATNPDIDNLGESLEDTLKDLASYAIMTLIELDNEKPVGVNGITGDVVFKGDLITHNKDKFHPHYRLNDINVGDKFLCINTVISDEGQMPYIIGKTYTSEINGCITNEMGDVDHKWKDVPYFYEHFKRID